MNSQPVRLQAERFWLPSASFNIRSLYAECLAVQGDPTDSVLNHFRFRLIALLSTICSPPTIGLTHNVHHGVGFPEHSITPGWQVVLHLQTKGEVMSRRMERASLQKNRKFIHPAPHICVKSFCLYRLLSKQKGRKHRDWFRSLSPAGVAVTAVPHTSKGKSVLTYPCSFLLGVNILLPGASLKAVCWSKSNLLFL